MAHELKTPLSILNRDIEILTEKYAVDPVVANDLHIHIQRVSKTISSFLDWAELNNLKNPGSLFVIHFRDVLMTEVRHLRKIYGDRLQVDTNQDFQVLCNPAHPEQLINNLLSNALKYSEARVDVQIHSQEVVIKDQGPGIPLKIIEKLGSPFNRGVQNGKGVGLGLAWVKSICDLYQWKYSIETSSGTEVRIAFPVVQSDEE